MRCNTGAAETRHVRHGLFFGLVALAVMAAVTGSLGVRTYEAVQEDRLRTLLLEAGRTGAVTLTNVSHTDADAHVKRILDSATGPFFEDFQNRSQSFIQTVRQTRSTTEGSVVAAGLESVDGDRADILVAVSVKTSLAGADAPPRLWRMRIGVQQVGQAAKVSDVEFVP